MNYLDYCIAQWQQYITKLEAEITEAKLVVDALRRAEHVPSLPQFERLRPRGPVPTFDHNPNRGTSTAMRRYIDEMVAEGERINAGECVRWMLANGVDGEYGKLMNQMPGLLKKEAGRDSTVQKDPAGGYKKRRSSLTMPLGAASVKG